MRIERINEFMERCADTRQLPGPYTFEVDPHFENVVRVTCANGIRLIAYLAEDDFEVYD